MLTWGPDAQSLRKGAEYFVEKNLDNDLRDAEQAGIKIIKEHGGKPDLAE